MTIPFPAITRRHAGKGAQDEPRAARRIAGGRRYEAARDRDRRQQRPSCGGHPRLVVAHPPVTATPNTYG